MKAVLICISDYCVYLHMQHPNRYTDMMDIQHIFVSINMPSFVNINAEQKYSGSLVPSDLWANYVKHFNDHHEVKLFSSAHIALLV